MKQFYVALLALGMTSTCVVRAGEQGPEGLGLHWARVSDEAQIGFVLDELRGLAQGRGSERIVRKHVARGVQLSSVLQNVPPVSTANVDAQPNIVISDAMARVNVGGKEVRFEKRNNTWELVGGALPVSPSRVMGTQTIETG
jgi:hypothetical protein